MRAVILFLILGATFIMACTPEPTDAIDTSEAQLVNESAPEYDPAYLDDLTDRAVDATIGVLLTMEPEEIEQVISGDLSFQDAAGMNDAEFEEYWLTIQGLAAESEAVLAEEELWRDLLGEDDILYKKDDLKCDGNMKWCLITALFSVMWAGPTVGGPILATATGYCYCQHCKGSKLDRVCGKKKE